MPIRPENRNRYPKNWPEISKRIRFERAKGRCENTITTQSADGEIKFRCTARHGLPHPMTGSKVVLTVAHLDHTPENCDDENLKAMCQKCHLAYDKDHHIANARSRRSKMDDMFSKEIDNGQE